MHISAASGVNEMTWADAERVGTRAPHSRRGNGPPHPSSVTSRPAPPRRRVVTRFAHLIRAVEDPARNAYRPRQRSDRPGGRPLCPHDLPAASRPAGRDASAAPRRRRSLGAQPRSSPGPRLAHPLKGDSRGPRWRPVSMRCLRHRASSDEPRDRDGRAVVGGDRTARVRDQRGWPGSSPLHVSRITTAQVQHV